MPLSFEHPLVREVVLDDLGPARRRHDHAMAAVALHREVAAAT